MTDAEIIQYVQYEMLDPQNQQIEQSSDDKLLMYKYRTANRLIMNRFALSNGKISQSDFEISLRDFMLVFRTSLNLDNYVLSDESLKFGFFQNSSDGKIWMNSSIPQYANSLFWNKVYMQEHASKQTEISKSLATNMFIQDLTGFDYYKSEEQKLIVTGALNLPVGYTALLSMSTGGGKSLASLSVSYQETNGLTIIVVPTVSLMIDQISNAKAIVKHNTNDEIFEYHSGVSLQPFLNALHEKKARILYVSPETLIRNQSLIDELEKANADNYIKNLIIDEAHVICEWGDSFRVDFQCLEAVRKKWMNMNPNIRTFLMSATFCKQAVTQLKQAYSSDGRWIEIRCDRLREEILFDVIKCHSFSEKQQRVIDMVRLLPHPLIVYVKNPSEAEKLKNELETIGMSNIRTYTGFTSNDEREKNIFDWKQDVFSIMIATCAFGVGVDKPDVRSVLHTYLPENANKYYQEAGRGGRDGLPSLSCVLFTDDDIEISRKFVSKVLTPEKLIGRWFSMIDSPKSERKNNGIIRIDTSVKPVYADDENAYLLANNADVNWNVYVILLLRRSGLIEVLDVEYNNRYIFTVRLIDSTIGFHSDTADATLTQIREKEWTANCADFNIMMNSLNRVGKHCWSDMFNTVYELTDAYCAGCNCHASVYSDSFNRFPLKRKISYCEDKSQPISSLLSSKVGICFAENINDCVEKLVNIGIKILVGFDDYFPSDRNPMAVQWTYKEFYDLYKTAPFFLNGCVAFLCPSNKDDLLRLISLFSVSKQTIPFHSLLISEDDTYVQEKNKKLSELINGPCFHSYILEVNNV